MKSHLFLLIAFSHCVLLVSAVPASPSGSVCDSSKEAGKECIIPSTNQEITWKKRSDRDRASSRSRRGLRRESRGSQTPYLEENEGEEEAPSSSSNARSFGRSEPFNTITQLGQAVMGGYIASQALNLDMQHRRGIGIADHDGSNPYSAPGALHAMAGAAVASVVTDPAATYSTVKKCFGEACRSLSFKGLSLNDVEEQSTSDTDSFTGFEEPSPTGRLRRKKSKKFENREERMAASKAKKTLLRQKSNVSSSS